MRTTLSIDDGVLAAAQDRPLGAVIPDLARGALDRPLPQSTRNGLQLLARKPDPAPLAAPVTLDLVNALRDEGA